MMAVGIDFTARDIQEADKKKGLPWTSAKGRPGFAAVGNFIPLTMPCDLELSVDGAVRQRGNTKDMIFPIEKIIDHLDRTYGLAEGDLIFTGTPAGVAPLAAGARGVYIAGCVPEDCQAREGSELLAQRLNGSRLPRLKRVAPGCVRLDWYSPVEVRRFLRDLRAFQGALP